MKQIALLIASLLVLSSSTVWAQCKEFITTPVTSLSAGFDAWKVVTNAMAECGDFTAELDQDFGEKQAAAMAANPSQYSIAGVANNSLVPLLSDGLVRPLDDLVAKYGQDLTNAQLIRIDGQIMAIAMMVNAQHFMYRTDVFEDLGLDVPTTYDEVLEAAQIIQDAGVVDYPLGGTYKAGLTLGLEFINHYLSYGGTFFNDDNTPALNNENTVAALERMKALIQYMDPEILASDSTYVQQQFQQGRIAMANLWASRAGAMDNAEESQVVGLVEFAAAPANVEGSPPAATLWWDGMAIASNISDEEAEAAFKLMMEGLKHEVLAANPDTAIWLSNEPIDSRVAKGAVANAQAGAPSFPASNPMGIMFEVLGNEISDYLLGSESAEETIADIEAAYIASAKEGGLIE